MSIYATLWTLKYIAPLIVLSGSEYAAITFDALHQGICDALRGSRPRVIVQTFTGDGEVRIVLEDGTSREVKRGEGE
jgi:hypothetical protein